MGVEVCKYLFLSPALDRGISTKSNDTVDHLALYGKVYFGYNKDAAKYSIYRSWMNTGKVAYFRKYGIIMDSLKPYNLKHSQLQLQ